MLVVMVGLLGVVAASTGCAALAQNTHHADYGLAQGQTYWENNAMTNAQPALQTPASRGQGAEPVSARAQGPA
jgi:hypothetical protein